MAWNLGAPETNLGFLEVLQNVAVLKNLQKFTEKEQERLCKTSYKFIRKEALAQVFPFEFWEFFKIPFFAV